MKFGLLTYEDTYRGTNIGDYIQSLAAEQFLPSVDNYLNREHLNTIQKDPIKLIMNGWFTHHPENWPPSPYIDPLFVAFHINSSHAGKLLTKETIDYLKSHEPIGCRDFFTRDLLHSYDIDSYFSGCLTLTLDKYKVNFQDRNDKVIIVDPLFNLYSFEEALTSFRFFTSYILKGKFTQSFVRHKILKKLISRDITREASYRHHMLKPNSFSENDRFRIAKGLLNEYAHAKCVITSRIHCALPCLALETPVIFINGFKDNSNISRLNGLREFFNVIDIDIQTGKILRTEIPLENGRITLKSIIPNKTNYLEYANHLRERVSNFVRNE